jgi:hypothetical protein
MESYLYGLLSLSRDIQTNGRHHTASRVLSCTLSLVEISEVLIFREANWAHMQVGGSSGRSDPLVRDHLDPDR